MLYITVVEVLAIFINADRRIKEVKIDHETEKEILLMTPPIFLSELPTLPECK